MKKKICLITVLLAVLSNGEPMESHTNYNVILVHGAGGSETGLDCANDNSIKEAIKVERDGEGYFEIIGGYGKGIDIDFDLSGRGLGVSVLSKKRKSSAKDMDLEDDDGKNIGLLRWLTDNVELGNRELPALDSGCRFWRGQ